MFRITIPAQRLIAYANGETLDAAIIYRYSAQVVVCRWLGMR